LKSVEGSQGGEDAEGNPYVVINGKPFYTNKQGLSSVDAVGFAGDILQFLPAAKLASLAKGFATRIGIGGLSTGAISGATNTTSTEDSYNGFNPAVIPGIGMNIKNGFAVNISFGSLSYSTITTDFANKSSLNTSSLGFNFGAQNFAVGVSKNFCTKGHHHGEGSESRRMKDDDKE
jgi:hypothetical protein